MLVMLLNMKVNKLVKVEVLAVTRIPEGLSFVIMELSMDTTCGPPRSMVCKVQYTWHPFLVLLNFFTWLHQPDLSQQV